VEIFNDGMLGGTVNAFDKSIDSTSASGTPEWDYWKQRVFGETAAVDPAVSYKPPSGLPTRRQ